MKHILVILLGALVPLTARAVSLQDYFDCTGQIGCGEHDIALIIAANVTSIVEWGVVAVAVLAFAYGGVRLIVSRGTEGKETGKKAIMYASIGLLLAWLTGRILYTICTFFYTAGGGSCPFAP